MLAKPVSYPTGAFRQRVLEATLRELGAYGELTAAEVAFVKALDLPNLTLAALRDMPNIAPDGLPSPKRCLARAACSVPSNVCAGTMSFDDPNIQVGPSFNINSLQGYLDWEARQPCASAQRGLRRHCCALAGAGEEGQRGGPACHDLRRRRVQVHRRRRGAGAARPARADEPRGHPEEASAAAASHQHRRCARSLRSLVLAAHNVLGFADGWTLVCLYGGGGHQAKSNACCVCCRGAFGRVRRVRRR
jgi:hypothetical protein